MFKFSLVLLLSISALGCSSVNPIADLLTPINSQASLTQALDQITQTENAPGLFVVVVKNDVPVYLRGFGSGGPAGHAPIDQTSVFNLWSISKLYTSLAVLNLASEGKINLDDPVCKHLDWLEFSTCSAVDGPGFDTGPTVRSLLQHTAGIPDIGMKLYASTEFQSDPLQRQKTVASKLLPKQKRWSKPDGAARYSNSHYLLLAAIVEHVSGESFDRYLQRNVFSELNLGSTGFRLKSDSTPMLGSHPVDLTSFFAFRYVNKERAVHRKVDGRYWFNPVYNASLGSTGALSNGQDMASFMISMLHCLRREMTGALRTSCDAILESPLTKVEKSPARGVRNLKQRLGWFVSSTEQGESYSHGGSGMGFSSMLQLFPEQDVGIFVVANDTYFDRRGGLSITQAIARQDWLFAEE